MGCLSLHTARRYWADPWRVCSVPPDPSRPTVTETMRSHRASRTPTLDASGLIREIGEILDGVGRLSYRGSPRVYRYAFARAV